MSAILKFDFQNRKQKQRNFSEENYLNFIKKTQFRIWKLHFSLHKGKQEQAMETLLCH